MLWKKLFEHKYTSALNVISWFGICFRFDDVFTDTSVKKKSKSIEKKGFPKKVQIKSKSEIPTMTCLLLLV